MPALRLGAVGLLWGGGAYLPGMDQNLTLRRARPDDLAAVDRLLAQSYPRLLKADYPPSILVTALPLIARARPELMASGRYFVAEDAAGDLVGAGGWSLASPVAGRRMEGVAHVRHLVCDPARVRQGIGRALIGAVIVDALAGGMRWLDCFSTRTAVPFYAALGFRVLHEVEVTLRPGIAFPTVRMMRQILPGRLP